MRETVLLGENDSLADIRDKLAEVQARRVALVIPPRSTCLRSEVDLALMARQAQALGLDLVLVTHDRRIKEWARAHGLRTAARAEGAQQMRARNPRRTVTGLAKPVQEAATAIRCQASIEARRRWADMGRLRQRVAVLILGGGAVLALALGLVLLVPSASIELEPVGEYTEITMPVLASIGFQQVDYEQGAVPARIATIEVVGEESGQTTGRQSRPDQHATGEVVFANKTTEPVTVPKGTVVRTADGQTVRFYTLLDVEVPRSFGATARVPIMAFDAGPAGNVPALTIRQVEGELAFKVEALNDRPTEGGSEKRVGIVASQDYDRLRALLMQRLQREAHDLLVRQLGAGEWIPQDSLELVITEEVFDHPVDEPADMLNLIMKVRVSGVAVQGVYTRELLARMLEVKRGGGRVVNEATLKVEQPFGQARFDGQVVRFTARASALLMEPMDLKGLGQRFAGSTVEQAQQALSREHGLRRPPVIHVQPGWWPWLPWLPGKITVRLVGGS
ncbi:MAG: baseplate J/gp47 family protein [Anaerolineae bacterium]